MKKIIITIILVLVTVSCEDNKTGSVNDSTPPVFVPNTHFEAEKLDMVIPTNDATEEEIVEDCTDVEIQLNNGSCVYNNCQENICGNFGTCNTDLDDGRISCACPDGYRSLENGFDCSYRTGRYDIEAIDQIRQLYGPGRDIVSHWNFLIGTENAVLRAIEFKIYGDTEYFSDFTLEINGRQFGQMTNAHPLYNGSEGEIMIQFSELVDTPENAPLLLEKSSANWMRLWAHKAENNSSVPKTIHIEISSGLGLVSDDFRNPVGLDLYLRPDHTLGSVAISDSYCPTEQPLAVPKTIAVIN